MVVGTCGTESEDCVCSRFLLPDDSLPPTECGGQNDLQCGGECDPEFICQVISTEPTMCGCEPDIPVPCGVSVPECDGECPEGEVCSPLEGPDPGCECLSGG